MSIETASVPTPLSVPARPSPTPEEVLEELRKILLSRHLKEAQQLHAFLDFVVHETLAGRQDALKEYLLGCKVFGRKADYDPRQDGIVRVQATALRKKLANYYQDEGVGDAVVIELIRGGYVPSFRYLTHEKPVVEAPRPKPASHRTHLIAFLAGCALSLMVVFAWAALRSHREPFSLTHAEPTDFPQLWSPFFANGAPAVVAYGVPLFYDGGGLFMRDVQVNVPGNESEGRIAEFGRTFGTIPVPTDDTYTGVGEAQGTNLVANFLTSRGVPVRIASARLLGRSDLAGHNLVVISSLRFQTFLHDLSLPADFHFLPVRPEVIQNDRPLPGESRQYVFGSGAGISTSYALISLWPGKNPGQRILSIGGVHTWATQAATEFLLDRNQLQALARRFKEDTGSGVHGRPSPYFQVLLRVEGRGNHSQTVEYLTHHYLTAPVK